jgi:PIN domain nuclease of toxin-antitoxin system
MKLLLDSHAFLWLDSDPARLSSQGRTWCSDPSNTLLLSVASIWELQIKVQSGKLILARPLVQIIDDQQKKNSVQVIAIHSSHVFLLDSFPLHHKDPFDRILVAQAKAESADLLSNDALLKAYPVNVVW